MSFLDKNSSEFLSARLTQKGRNAIAKGDFKISYFAVGDSEYNYSGFTGSLQNVLAPLDKDTDIKYPFLYESGSDNSYGIPVTGNTYVTMSNNMGASGFVSGQTINSNVVTSSLSFTALSGTTGITVPVAGGKSFRDSEYVSLVMGGLNGSSITGYSNSFIYKLMNVVTTGSTEILTLDRPTPQLGALSGNAVVISNNAPIEFGGLTCDTDCEPKPLDPSNAHDPWTLDIVWSKKPIGFNLTDDDAYKFTGSCKISTKELLGYNSDSGQYFTDITGGTITGTTFLNCFNEEIEILPSDQNAIAIIHYSENGDIINDQDRFYKYDDYFGDDTSYFEVYIPYLDYHRNTGTTIGAKFHMSSSKKYMVSNVNSTKMSLEYRDLLDEQNYKVGKIFVNNKVIVFDDQEIVAALDYKSNRRYTLPSPKVELTHSPDSSYLLDTTGKTLYVTYVFSYTTDTKLNALPCMDINKMSADTPSNVVLKFTGTTSFDSLQSTAGNNLKSGFVANKLYVLAQLTTNGAKPSPNLWKAIDKTPALSGGFITPSSMTGLTITLSASDYNYGTTFVLGDHTGQSYSGTTSQFGDEQPFAGSVKVTRSSSIEEMNFLVNLPSGKFATSQNPTFVTGNSTKITEVALLDSNKTALVIAKTATPVSRTSSAQVFAVKLDF
jgi:hypothetical protein